MQKTGFLLAHHKPYAILFMRQLRLRQKGNDGATLFTSLFYESGVIVMTDFEILSIVIMIIALVISAMSINDTDK